jgi:hypothetical protein
MQYIRGNHKLDNPVKLETYGIYRFIMNVFEHAHFQCKDISVLSAVRVCELLPVKKSILFSYFYLFYCQDFISYIGFSKRFIVRRYFQ